MVRRSMPKDKILQGIKQSYHHASELGLAETEPGKTLSSLKIQVESTPEAGLAQQPREELAGKIENVLHGVSGLARAQQPDFRPGPS
jgi:hypothetical protein